MDLTIFSIFLAGSRTYFYSTIFFPPHIRDDVFALYSFVRTADDYVDAVPQQTEEFYAFTDAYRRAAAGEATGDPVIDGFAALAKRRQFDPGWADAFLGSMEQDITTGQYETEEDLLGYLYGSSEVVGLMMARILRLPVDAYPAARLLGRAMQHINFIRDIPEDLELGRVYFPQEALERFGLSGLEYSHVRQHPAAFDGFLRDQLHRYCTWQGMAEDGFAAIPTRSLIPVKTASDMYRWTALRIYRQPRIVYAKKVKPSIPRIVSAALYNAVALPSGRSRADAPRMPSLQSEE